MFPFSLPLFVLKEDFEAKRGNNELEKITIKFLSPEEWKIITPYLFPAETIRKLFYSIYRRLNYLFDYLDYQVEIQVVNFLFDQNEIQAYFSFIKDSHFF